MPPKSKQKKEVSKAQPSDADQRQLPNWPTLQPLIPSSDLTLTTLVPSQIITISNFWTSTLCKNYVSFLSTLPLVTTPGTPKRGDAVRVNDRFQVEDAIFAERLWSQTALRELVNSEAAGSTEAERKKLWGGEVIGLNPNIRVYRYSKGQFFDQHCELRPCIFSVLAEIDSHCNHFSLLLSNCCLALVFGQSLTTFEMMIPTT
jgi:hypothetical protein